MISLDNTTSLFDFSSDYKTTQLFLESISKSYSICQFNIMSKLITVFGATGNQGGSVIKHILDSPQLSTEYRIRAVTRDTDKPAARALADQGVEVVRVRDASRP